MLCQCKPMANSLAAHDNSIVEFFVGATVALTSMEQHLELVATSLLCRKDLLKEVINPFVVIFLVHQIERTYHVVFVVYM